jgi:hypothetical protein
VLASATEPPKRVTTAFFGVNREFFVGEFLIDGKGNTVVAYLQQLVPKYLINTFRRSSCNQELVIYLG